MKLTIIGAAGVRTPLIIQEIIRRQEQLNINKLSLMDIDLENLSLMGSVTQLIESSNSVRFSIDRGSDPISALADADFVITTFRVGGPSSRIIDEKVPLELGFLGQETTGAGGFAMGMRSIPVLLEYIQIMKKVCPDAWLINFANPSGMMTEAIHKISGWQRAIGICDGPSSMLELIASAMHVPSTSLFMEYFGLNHLGWVRSIHDQEREYLPAIIQMLEAAGGFPGYRIAPDLVQALGLIPNEYLYYYYYQKQAVQEILNNHQTRGEQVAKLNQQLIKSLNSIRDNHDPELMNQTYLNYIRSRSHSYMNHQSAAEDQTSVQPTITDSLDLGYANLALDLIEALIGTSPRQLILNVPNHDSITGMAYDDVVEIPVHVNKNDLQPVPIGFVPDHCLGLMKTVKAFESWTIQAAVERDYQKALTALSIHPLIFDRSSAKKILDGYCSRHGSYFPKLH